MKQVSKPVRPRQRIGGKMAAVHAQIALAAVAVVVQLWLLTTSLDAFLAGEIAPLWSFAVVSAAAFLGSLGLLVATRE